jgi:ribosomal protein S15P/S13E
LDSIRRNMDNLKAMRTRLLKWYKYRNLNKYHTHTHPLTNTKTKISTLKNKKCLYFII